MAVPAGRRDPPGRKPILTRVAHHGASMTDLPPIHQAASLSQQAAEVLRERILSGDFGEGERLNEAALARQLGTSRGPIREALKQLRAEGLVREEPRRGAFIVELTAHDVEEIYELRAALETRAVRLLLERRDLPSLRELDDVLAALKRAAKAKDRLEVARLDLEFHATVCRLSGNSRLHRAFVEHAAVLRTLLVVEEAAYFSSLVDIGPQHEPLLEALRAGNVRKAEAAFNEHLEDAKVRLVAYTEGTHEDGASTAPAAPLGAARARRS
jgi:GntR family transcriptional regulator, gluconate operon transcriptional repressor